jgi:hypothetical protein
MPNLPLNTSQKVVVTATPVDTVGATATNFNQAVWTTDKASVATITDISADGLTATVVAQGVGSAMITVTGQQGNFQPNYSSSFTVDVVAGVPVAFTFSFATPVAK